MSRQAELEADNAKYAAAFQDGNRPGPPVKQMVRAGSVSSRAVRLLCRRTRECSHQLVISPCAAWRVKLSGWRGVFSP